MPLLLKLYWVTASLEPIQEAKYGFRIAVVKHTNFIHALHVFKERSRASGEFFAAHHEFAIMLEV